MPAGPLGGPAGGPTGTGGTGGAVGPVADGASPLDVEGLRTRVGTALTGFFATQSECLEEVGSDLAPVLAAAQAFLESGKRLRPAFAYWGWRGAGGPDNDAIVNAASSLELLHACALVHDDVMDDSDTRRGQPSVHKRFAARHAEAGWHGEPDGFGLASAVLLGDMCLVWADQMLWTSGLGQDALQRAQPLYDRMRIQLMAGQYLDVLEQARGSQSVESSLRVARFKSAKYTVEGPLLLGAALAGAGHATMSAYTAYGVPIGEAFQLRDDVLGVFGDPAETGKPAGDDLREGKRTVLVAEAVAAASSAQRELVDRLLGDPALDAQGVERLREVIVETGALDRTESLIAQRRDTALEALATAEESGLVARSTAHVLRALAVAATARRV
ncbi:polyprenyl synthetase family protein [Motilibacter sp. E257]|uniref:Polyprenyl synthetase family protein n=2 Tax=Motilibacter deserti TaxID=2714956 RepID=A0ABX0GNE7_9ACTN|nr:polyprenyl synthetase family protein [Motilibacter deserti]NHC12342.1 polyprenyl synthetase family protein [Motilibacter deserti]